MTTGHATGHATDDGFEALYRRELRYVWNTLRWLGVREADLEDMAHEVFIVVWRRLPEYVPAASFRSWLFGIAYRTVSHYHRATRVRREELAPDAPEHPSADPTPDVLLGIRQQQELVLRALDSLTSERRAVFVMYELDGHAAPEIATALEIPLNTAYSRLRLAREDFVAAVRRLRRGAS